MLDNTQRILLLPGFKQNWIVLQFFIKFPDIVSLLQLLSSLHTYIRTELH